MILTTDSNIIRCKMQITFCDYQSRTIRGQILYEKMDITFFADALLFNCTGINGECCHTKMLLHCEYFNLFLVVFNAPQIASWNSIADLGLFNEKSLRCRTLWVTNETVLVRLLCCVWQGNQCRTHTHTRAQRYPYLTPLVYTSSPSLFGVH